MLAIFFRLHVIQTKLLYRLEMALGYNFWNFWSFINPANMEQQGGRNLEVARLKKKKSIMRGDQADFQRRGFMTGSPHSWLAFQQPVGDKDKEYSHGHGKETQFSSVTDVLFAHEALVHANLIIEDFVADKGIVQLERGS